MEYNSAYEEWICYCNTVIYNNKENKGCHCNFSLKESYDSFLKRLGLQNNKGRYSVNPPSQDGY